MIRDASEIIDFESATFKQDPTDLESTIHENVKISHMEESEASVYIRYGRDVYKFKTELTEEENLNIVKGSLEKVNTPEGNLGKYATYQGKTWIVLYDDSEKVELISADALGNVTLGGSTFAEGKELYNNLIETLKQACKDATGITTGIRNVGGPVEDPETPTYVTLNDLKTKGFVPQSDKEAQIGTLIADIKQGDENYLNDYNQMKSLGILVTDTPENYWLASRFVYVESAKITLRVRDLSLVDDFLNDCDLWDVYADGSGYGAIYGGTRAIRPVVSLSTGILDGKSGEGTRNNPINLD